MSRLEPQWEHYLALQAKLKDSRTVDDANWGREAALNRILAASPERRLAVEEIDRAARSEARRERHRARLRRHHLASPSQPQQPEHKLEARQIVGAIRRLVTSADWALFCALGDGHDYKEIAAQTSVTPGALRVRVLRLREKLQAA
jgi:DNA-binding NarL/FixJ family response regulator